MVVAISYYDAISAHKGCISEAHAKYCSITVMKESKLQVVYMYTCEIFSTAVAIIEVSCCDLPQVMRESTKSGRGRTGMEVPSSTSPLISLSLSGSECSTRGIPRSSTGIMSGSLESLLLRKEAG